MPSTISNIPTTWEKPGFYFDLRYGQGVKVGSSSELPIRIWGNKLASGSASTNLRYGPLRSQSQVNDLFGRGSEIARMFAQVIKTARTIPIYAIAIPEASGTKATGSIEVSGTPVLPGTVEIRVLDQVFSIGFSASDGYADIAALISDAISARVELPLTASDSSGTVSLEARQTGTRGNELRYSARVLETGTGVTVTPSTHTAMTGGTGSDDSTAALAADADFFAYYNISAANDATQFQALIDLIDSKAAAPANKLMRAYCGFTGTNASLITLCTGRNAERGCIAWLENANLPPAELASYLVGVIASQETNLGNGAAGRNFCNWGEKPGDVWSMSAPFDQSPPDDNDINAAIINGGSPINVLPNGQTSISRLCTTYSESFGEPDKRIRDHQQLSVGDKVCRDVAARVALNFGGKLFGPNPPQGQSAPKDVVYPDLIVDNVTKYLDDAVAKSLLENATFTAEQTDQPDRVYLNLEFKVAPIGATFIMDAAEVSSA